MNIDFLFSETASSAQNFLPPEWKGVGGGEPDFGILEPSGVVNFSCSLAASLPVWLRSHALFPLPPPGMRETVRPGLSLSPGGWGMSSEHPCPVHFQGRRSRTEAGPFTQMLWPGSFNNRLYVACIIKHKDLLLCQQLLVIYFTTLSLFFFFLNVYV